MMSRLRSFLRALLHRDSFEQEMKEELELHQEMRAAHLMETGMSQQEATRQARIEFGARQAYTDECREARGLQAISSLAQDLRYALRGLRRSPGFTSVALLSLSLGIGGNSAVFSIVDAVLLRPLAVPRANEIHTLQKDEAEITIEAFSYPLFDRIRTAAPPSTKLAALSRTARASLTVDGQAQPGNISYQLVSGEFFDALEVRPSLGRLLSPSDNRNVNSHPVAVISHAFWQRQFASSPDILHREIVLNGQVLNIVGVAQPNFRGVWLDAPADVWTPLVMQSAMKYAQNVGSKGGDTDKPWVPQEQVSWLAAIARVPTGQEGALAAAASAVRTLDPADQRVILLQSASRGLSVSRDRMQRPLYVLMTVVAVLLLIACANLANLLLARASTRQREISIRLSIGASRRRLIRQLLTESLLLSFMGGCLSLLVAHFAAQGLLWLQPLGAEVAIDLRVAVFTFCVAAGATILFGLAPAFSATRMNANAALKSASRTHHGGARWSLANLLVAAQVALCLLLLVGAGLFLRSFQNLLRLDPGYEVNHVVQASISPLVAGYRPDQRDALTKRILEALEAIPGVQSAVVTNCRLASGCRTTSNGFFIDGYQPAQGETTSMYEHYVTHKYFATVGMQVLRGRGFAATDTSSSRKVAVVNESMAKRYFSGLDPIGRRIGYGRPDTEIVGVVRDSRVMHLREEPKPMAFYPLEQTPWDAEMVAVRTAGDPTSAIASLRLALAKVDPNLPVSNVTKVAEQVEGNLTQERMLSVLTISFGGLALMLACFGLYGVMSCTVTRRTPELGVRLALGAERSNVLWMVLRESMLLVGIGLAVGVPVALMLSDSLRGILYNVDPRNALTLVGASACLAVVALVAGYLPAWRASRVDPIIALRYE